ncbi:MAG TPA: hypothetical protein ENN46_04705 [Candidatus Woesearchaeota archaeon]|nr:hypothetical protein [Candidatus Woesearchaeota archaeon]
MALLVVCTVAVALFLNSEQALGVEVLGTSIIEPGLHLIRADNKYTMKDSPYPEFINTEDVYAVTCIEEDSEISHSLVCMDNNNFEMMESYRWSDKNCYIASLNLDVFECENALVMAEYIVEGEVIRIEKRIHINVVSKILDLVLENQFEDGGWKDAFSTAVSMWGLSSFKELFEQRLEKAMYWLKVNRDDSLKCWPIGNCDTRATSNILALLTLSDYDDNHRVIRDGNEWIQEMQNFIKDDEWTLKITPVINGTTLTLVAYEEKVLDRNFTVKLNEVKEYTIEPEEGKRIIVISDAIIYLNISNKYGQNIFFYAGDNISYDIQGACWSRFIKGGRCDYKSTAYSSALDISETRKEETIDWMLDNVRKDLAVGMYYGNGHIDENAFFLYSVRDIITEEKPKEVLNYFLYKQNNDGSWGSGNLTDMVIETAYAIMALKEIGYDSNYEPIRDATKWVTQVEQNISESSSLAMGAAFSVLKPFSKPFILFDPKILLTEQPSSRVRMTNPTPFDLMDLTYQASDSIKNYVTISERTTLPSYSYKLLTITRSDLPENKNLFGEIKIFNQDQEVGRLPVILSQLAYINASYPERTVVYGDSKSLALRFQKSAHEFFCSISWVQNDIEDIPRFKAIASTPITLKFKDSVNKQDNYAGTISCELKGKKYDLPIQVYISRYVAVPFTLNTTVVRITDDKIFPAITATNNLNLYYPLRISIDRPEYFDMPEVITISENEEKEITIRTALSSFLANQSEFTDSAIITIEGLEYKQEVIVTIDVESKPSLVKEIAKVVGIILLVVIIAGSVAAYFYREKLTAFLNKLYFFRSRIEKKETQEKLVQLKKEEISQSIENTFRLLKMRKRSELEIYQELRKNFSKEEIAVAAQERGLLGSLEIGKLK